MTSVYNLLLHLTAKDQGKFNSRSSSRLYDQKEISATDPVSLSVMTIFYSAQFITNRNMFLTVLEIYPKSNEYFLPAS